MVKKLTGATKKVKQFFKKKTLKDWTKWNRKMGGRSFVITSGVIGTLYWSPPFINCKLCECIDPYAESVYKLKYIYVLSPPIPDSW